MPAVFHKLRNSPVWVWLLLFAFLLRVFAIGTESFWFDEAFGARVIKLPFDQLLTALQGDNSPPLYYYMEWVVSHIFGNSEVTLRFPSAIMGTVAVLLLWQIALALGFDKKTALAAGLLAAVMPGVLYYGQEARMYAMLLCAVLAAVLAAIKQRWLWYGLATLLTLYSHNLGLVTVVTLNIAVLGQLVWKNRENSARLKALAAPAAAMGMVVILWLPWTLTEIRQTTHLGQSFWIAPLTIPSLIAPIFNLTIGERMAPSITYAGYVVSLAFTIYTIWFCRKWLRKDGFLIIAVLVGPALLLALISFVWHPIYLSRVLIGSLYLLCLLWAYTICYSARLDQQTILALLIPIITIAVIAQYWPNQTLRLPWRERVTALEAGWQPGDVLYYCSTDVGSVTNIAVIVGYYMPNYPEKLCPAVPSLPTEVQTDYFGYTRASIADLYDLGYKRAWLIVDRSSDPLPAYYCQTQIEYPDAKICRLDLQARF